MSLTKSQKDEVRKGVPMVLKINEKQAAKVHRLARDECANCDNGNCLLLDDGDECRCVQLLSISSISCRYFRDAVLPLDRKLHAQITEQNAHNNTTRKGAERRNNEKD